MYYLTHDSAGHQVFLLKEISALQEIKEPIEQSAIAYHPSTGAIKVYIGDEWIEASIGGGGGQPIISADVDFNGFSITDLNELYAELVQLSDAVQIEAHDDRLVLNANDGEGGWSAPVRVFGVSSEAEYADEAISKGFFDANKTNIITGKLNYIDGEFRFEPDFLPNARATYVNDLFKKGIDTKIFITGGGGGYTGYVCRLIYSFSNAYACELLDLPNPSEPSDGFTAIHITNLHDTFMVQFNEA